MSIKRLEKHTAIAFSLEDVRSTLKRRGYEQKETEVYAIEQAPLANGRNNRESQTKKAQSSSKSSPDVAKESPLEHRRLEAVSITDILGFNLNEKSTRKPRETDSAPRKFSRYYRLLANLRDHVQAGLEEHSKDTLNYSVEEPSENLSHYSQNIADVGTDNFNRDFALSLVSNEHDALFEIEQAISRIRDGSYGVCQVTGKPISRERLEAVPFTRFSKEGQDRFEATGRKDVSRMNAFVKETA